MSEIEFTRMGEIEFWERAAIAATAGALACESVGAPDAVDLGIQCADLLLKAWSKRWQEDE